MHNIIMFYVLAHIEVKIEDNALSIISNHKELRNFEYIIMHMWVFTICRRLFLGDNLCF